MRIWADSIKGKGSRSKKEVIGFCKIDVDECFDFTIELNVTCMPTFFVYVKGDVRHRLAGSDVSRLKRTVEELLENESEKSEEEE